MMVEKETTLSTQSNNEQTQGSEISLGEILKIILRRKYGILLILIASLVMAWIYNKAQTPEYHAVSVMMINENRAPGDLLATLLGPSVGGDNKMAKKDVELLQSYPIAELTVKELYKTTRKDSLEFFGKRKYLSPIDFLFSTIDVFHPLNADQKAEAWHYSDALLRLHAMQLKDRIRVVPLRDTNLLQVSVASPFADEAVFLTNTLCQTYKNADIIRNSEKYTQANKFIAEMIQDQQQKVAEADNALSQYMQSNKIYEVSGNTGAILSKVIEADARYNDIKAESRIASNSLAFLEKKLSDTDREISSRIAKNVNSQLGAIMDELRTLESDYIKMVREKGIDNPEVKIKRQQLDVVKTRYEQLSRSKIAGEIGYAGKAQKFSFDMVSEKLQIERKLNDLNFSASEYSLLKQYYESQLSMLPIKQQEFIKLQRDKEVVGKTYLYLKEKLDETRIMLGSEVGGVSIIGSAFKPFDPEKPVLAKDLLMGLVLGGLLAALYTFGAEMADNTVKDELFFRDLGLTVLSVIPLVGQKGQTPFLDNKESFIKRFLYSKSQAFREKVLSEASVKGALPMPMITDSLSSAFAESFRTLRTALDYSRVDFSRIDSSLKFILVSGTAMTEGKSTVCANLGMAYAISGKKTLIIDCDLRRASQNKKLNVKREPGLTDFLYSQQATIDESYFQPTHLDNLFVLSAGKKVPNPNEILGSQKMIRLLKELDGKFDKVVFDSPPLFLSDAAQLAHSVDGVLLAARMHFTNKDPIKNFAVDHFLRPLILGVAMIESRDSQRYGYGYGKYGYGKYGYGKYGYGQYEEEA
ncbi:MAG: polysaccharide biosynthesis tyrosine autokinase [Pelodictyon phaeoclathratiforme]